MLFCDTSAIAKLYVAEKESPMARVRLEAEDQVFASELARAELMGVFHRQLRERKWTPEKFRIAAAQFAKDDIAGFWTWLPLDTAIIDASIKTYTTLPGTVFLRSADCLHLVTAIHHGFSEVFTYDVRQIAAASALGLKAVAA